MAICDRLVRPKGPSVALAGPAAAMALEALEPRVMLSSAPAGGISSVWAAPIMPAWFHVLDSGVSQSQAHENEWIVQFTSDALRHVDSVADTIDLFASSPINFDILKGLGQAGQVLVKANEANTAYVEQWLSGNPGIAYYQPNYVMQLLALPDDPSFDELWGLNNTGQDGGTADADIDAPEAWDYTIGSADIIVGVTDTGVDYTHPDLADNMWINPGETADNGIDDDGNGFIDDIYGWDFGDDDSDPMDDSSIAGHGTHVAGTIGAVGDNGVGVAGVNWDVSIMALKIADQMGFQWNSSIIAANNYAAMMRTSFGVNICVTNNSYGGYGSDQGIYDSIKRLQSAGILFVAAAGNDDINNDTIPAYPASYDLDNIISVAATDRNDELASFSNYGKTSVDLSAPGVEILSTVPNGQYDGTYSGTSMACPHVVGVAALAWSFAPNATYQEIRDAILHGVDLLPDLRGKVATDGRLNAYNTLLQLSIATIQGSLFHDLNADGQRDPDPQVEPGLAGWTIYADENANRRYDVGEATGVTDADGNYEITGLQPGSYELAAIRSDGWVSTRPQSGFIAVQLRLPDEPGDYVVLADDLGVTNLGPTAIEQAVALDEDASLAITLAGTDVHEFEGVPLFEGIHDTPADELIFALTSQPAHGTLNVSRLAEGIIVYTPQANYNGDDEFYFTVTDTGNPADGSEGNAGTSDPVAVSITVTPVNDQPTAYGQWTLTNQDATGNITITLIGADLETEAGDLLFNAGDPAHGTLTALAGPNGPSWGYQPDVGYFGVDKFTFTVTDDGDPAGSGANPGNLDSEPVTVYVGVAQKVSIDSGEQYAFEVAAGVVGTVRLSGPGLATLYDASALVDADTGQAHPDPRHITEILIEGADDSTSLTFRMPRGARACLGGITVEGGSFGAIKAGAVDLYGDIDFGALDDYGDIDITDGTLKGLQLGDVVGDDHMITIGEAPTLTETTTMKFGRVDDLTVDSATPIKSIKATEWLESDGSANVIRAPWIGGIKIAGDFGASLDLAGSPGVAYTLGTIKVAGTVTAGTWDILGNVNAIKLNGANGLTIGDTKTPQTIRQMKLGEVSDAVVHVVDSIATVSAGDWLAGELNAMSIRSLRVAGDFGAVLEVGQADSPLVKVLNNARITGALTGEIDIHGHVGKMRLGAINGDGGTTVTIDGNALSLRVDQALALTPPESGSIGTLNVGGDAKVRGGNQRFAYTNRVLYSRPDNTYSLAELRLLDQPGMRWEYEQFFDSSDGPGWLTTNATVEKGQGDPTSHVLYSPLGDGDVRNVWIEDADGLNTTSMRINWGQNNSLQLGFIHPLAATPQMIRMGTRYSARERFEGGLVFRSLAETITAAVSGTAKVTNRMFDHGFVTVPAGTYWAVRGQTVTSIKGNVEFEYQDAFYRGRLTVTLRENWWASPTDGTIKSVTKMTIKVTAPRGIRLSHTVQSERELVNTDITYVTGVPAYENWFGNMPTAVGILAGYYDGVGYEDLIDGDASTQTDEVNNAIATEGAGGEYLFTDAGAVIVSPGTPGTGHIPDYALYDEIDDTDPAYFPYYDDLSDPDVVTETGISPHEDDCIADFLLTSRSIEGSVLGDGFFDDVAAGVENYFQHMGYTATAEHVDGEDFTWDDLVAEIDAGRPVLVDVDPNSYGMSEQLMVVFAYDLGSQQYGGYNTEDGDLHWYSFGAGESTSLDIIDAVLVRVE